MAQARIAAAGAGALAVAYYALRRPPAADELPNPQKNRAFVFVKPHADTISVEDMVRDELKGKAMIVKAEGDLTAETIDEKKLIDQHYYAIASKATILKPSELNIPKEKFQKTFGKSWDSVLSEGKALNAMDACKELGVDAEGLNKLWQAAKKNDKLAKFGGGFYCGEIQHKGKTLYVFNGFFMTMRSAFTAPGRKIHYYDVEWEPSGLSWSDFRGKVLGPTDPKDAPKDSLRGKVLGNWKKLGLKAEPNVGDNAVHASASPFEALAERMNWMGVKCPEDDYCKAMLKAGIPQNVIEEWTKDPQVKILPDGKRGSLFDALEDLDADACLAKAKELYKLQQ